MENFKDILYQAVLVAFGKILAKYDVFTQGVIMRDIGREIIAYLNDHGFGFNETGSIEDLNTLIDLFVKNGFAESLEVTPAEKGENYIWKNLYGNEAYKELYDLALNPFLACPLNLCMYNIAGKHKKKLVMYRKEFVSDSVTEAQYELADDDENAPDANLDQLVLESARLFEIATEKQKLFQKQANTDFLTGLHSRQSTMENGSRLFHYAQVDKKPFSILIIDIDRFKDINDMHGHASGDAVLKTLAAILKKSIRDSDIAGRLGGEEFAILLPGTPCDRAMDIAERLRKEVETTVFEDGKGNSLSITISVGVSCDTGENKGFEAFMEDADKALYSAKRSGRNAIYVYKD